MNKLFFICLVFLTAAANAEGYSETFTRITGIQPGVYQLAEGPKQCEFGDLELRDTVNSYPEKAPGIIFVLNGEPMALFIGGRDIGGERKLKWTSESSVSASKVTYVRSGTFNGKPVRWDLEIIPQKDGFTYKTEIKGKPVTCVLTR